MRRLILMRHAKAERGNGRADRDRPLDERGRAAAPRMGAYLAAEGLRPDTVLVSSARRTLETWEGVRAALDLADAESVSALYEAPASLILDAVRAASRTAACVLVIGHNPGIQELAEDLAGSGPEETLRTIALEFPTCALAVLDFDLADWTDVASGGGRLERFVRPGDLAGTPTH